MKEKKVLKMRKKAYVSASEAIPGALEALKPSCSARLNINLQMRL